MKRRTGLVALGLVVAGLAACSGGQIVPSPEPASSPGVGTTYETLDDLRDAFVAAGGACEHWTLVPVPPAEGMDVGSCDDDAALVLLRGPDETRLHVSELKEGSEMSGFGGEFLFGPNWIVNARECAGLAPAMGGTVATYSPHEDIRSPVSPITTSRSWRVGSDLAPGPYVVHGFYARRDAAGDVIDSDSAWMWNERTLMVVSPSDSLVELDGVAVPAALSPAFDPVANLSRRGTYRVGRDVVPGRYRLVGWYVMGQRLDATLETIEEVSGEFGATVTIEPTDFAVMFQAASIEPL